MAPGTRREDGVGFRLCSATDFPGRSWSLDLGGEDSSDHIFISRNP